MSEMSDVEDAMEELVDEPQNGVVVGEDTIEHRIREEARKFVPSASPTGLPIQTDERVRTLTQAHVQSFNFMLEDGLVAAVTDIPPREFRLEEGGRLVKLWVEDANILRPRKKDGSSDERLFPAECREGGVTYEASLLATICRQLDRDGPIEKYQANLGSVPIMVGSARCHLQGLSADKMVELHEEASEAGGYFICNGIERIIRMLQIPRRNYPMAITRSSYVKRGPLYTPYGVTIRCVRPDQSAITLTLHYLADGAATLRFSLRRQEFFLPVVLVLRALRDTTDREIFEAILGSGSTDTHLSDRVQLLLREAKDIGVTSRRECLTFLGSRFRAVLHIPATLSDEEAGQFLLDRFVLVHLTQVDAVDTAAADKFALLALMIRKLYLFVGGSVREDSADSLANQEILLGGHLYCMFLKEKLEELLQGIEATMRRELSVGVAAIPAAGAGASATNGAPMEDDDDEGGGGGGGKEGEEERKEMEASQAAHGKAGVALAPGARGGAARTAGRRRQVYDAYDAAYFRRLVDRQPSVGKKVYYLLATGTLVSSSGLDLMQTSGFTVVADKINYLRFLTHFRSVHRGQFFSEMKTTSVRKLIPECWGFLCPVHTPDGSPCGLLNHLAAPAHALAFPQTAHSLAKLILSLGVTPLVSFGGILPSDHLPVCLDGRVIGGAPVDTIARVATTLRLLKGWSSGGTLPAGEADVDPLVDSKNVVGDGGTKVGGGHDEESARLLATRRLFRDRLSRLTTFAVQGDSVPVTAAAAAAGAGGGEEEDGGVGWWRRAASHVPSALEVAFIPPANWLAEKERRWRGDEPSEDLSGPFPGLFLSTSPARLVRPVVQLVSALAGPRVAAQFGESGRMLELLSPLEQLYLDIAATRDDFRDIAGLLGDDVAETKEGDQKERENRFFYTHMEYSPMAMLSFAASLTPFSDLNQSPRNMYQCQMGKQTMGTPCHAFSRRADTKLYRIQSPQAPLVQCQAQAEYGMDEYPAGTNAVVAVIAYTGLDMEDAMIVNKAAYERGFAHASVYKTITVDLVKDNKGADTRRYIIANPLLSEIPDLERSSRAQRLRMAGRSESERFEPQLERDGIRRVGSLVRENEPLYSVFDTIEGRVKVVKHKDAEPAYIDQVTLLGGSTRPVSAAAGGEPLQRLSIKLRYNRNPVVGDKFSSRHGQKGVMSILWPQEDMPFSESGMSPDVIINPHAFPSRMTIGMLVESMAGKAGAMHGRFQDSTPFRFSEHQKAVDYFGQQLVAAGYSYYGSEPLYSGTTGGVLHADIYMGVVYYQRLRHMVSDKSQVRATGPVNNLTRQPVKGRKHHGGIRFGEMERDSLLAHGASFLLRDRLMNSSDRHIATVCKFCGSILSPMNDLSAAAAAGAGGGDPSAHHKCVTCKTGRGCVSMPLPYVFRYLAGELAGMNIRLTLDIAQER